MLLTLTTTYSPATDLGFLLHKNPARAQEFNLSFGRVHVFYPRADENTCTAAMMLDINPITLMRDRRGYGGGADQYVSDRPYVASSFLSVAIAQVFSSALAGTSRERSELAQTAIPMVATISVLPCAGGVDLPAKLFEPLGYAVTTLTHALDPQFPEWGDSAYVTLTLSQTITLRQLLTHLYVLIPVLDNEKHYWIGDDEVEKLLRHGDSWLAQHPLKETIVRRYLKFRHDLANAALRQLLDEDPEEIERARESHDAQEERVERPMRLNDQRLGAVISVLHASGAKRVLDLGCSNGNLLRRLLEDKQFEQIVGLDVSHRALEIAAERLRLDRLPETQRKRIALMHGSLTYRDKRLAGYDAAAVVEVIEHFDPPRLAAFERVIFGSAQPRTVVLTTPNVEYNVKFPTLSAGTFRHTDHRFEWTRDQFHIWSARIAADFGYQVRFLPVGEEDATVGPPTQMAVFSRISASGAPSGAGESG